jgi:hypothetical protein
MSKLQLKSVKKPVPLKCLGLALYSFWEGRTYGAEDMVPVANANKILQRQRENGKV